MKYARIFSVLVPFIGAVAGADAQPGDVPRPRPAGVPNLDPLVIESREKVKDQRWLLENDFKGTNKVPPTEWLKNKAQAGDLNAARKASLARKAKGETETPAQLSALEALYDEGIRAGVPEAFVGKGEIEWNRGNADLAVKRMREASARGAGEADYKLAVFKAQKPDTKLIVEPATTLLKRAADKGESYAALELGLALDRGFWRFEPTKSLRINKSPAEAVAWMERASALGSNEAALWLGLHYMNAAEGLVDLRRQRALEYLLIARKAGAALKEPASGKTFAELETSGALEPGLLGEIKRREAEEASVRARGNNVTSEKDAAGKDAVATKRIDHQVIELIGDSLEKAPVFNVVGLSPYKEIAAEGAIKSVSEKLVVLADGPSLPGPEAWRLEIIDGGRQVMSLPVDTIDAKTRTVRVATTVPGNLDPNVRYRLARYHTLFSTFGLDNRAGLKPATTAASGDEIIIYQHRHRLIRRVFFHADRQTWTDSATGRQLLSDVELAPGDAFVVKRTEKATLSLQVRGMVPAEPFEFTPAPGANLASVRKNAFGTPLAAQKGLPDPVATRDLPVLANQGTRWEFEPNGSKSEWWTPFGLSATDRVNLVKGSAAVLVNR